MKKIYILLFACFLLAVFSYYGTNLIYKYSGKNSDDKVSYREYREYEDENKSIETGTINKHGINKEGQISYVIGKPEQDTYSYEYYIKAYDNHVAIFNKHGSLYEYTGIVLSGLDDETRNYVTKGIYFKEIKDLFTFLESYSS
ncbi:MAG: hypothetical protein ACI4EF_08925 [Coprococcus sp.]